jgi:hypothetical protein
MAIALSPTRGESILFQLSYEFPMTTFIGRLYHLQSFFNNNLDTFPT